MIKIPPSPAIMVVQNNGISEERAIVGTKIINDILNGVYASLQMCLLKRFVIITSIKYNKTKMHFQYGQPQSFDIFGIEKMAESIQMIGAEASKINSTINTASAVVQSTAVRLDSTIARFMEEALPHFARAVGVAEDIKDRGLDLNLGDIKELMNLLKDPRFQMFGGASLYLMLEIAHHKWEVPYMHEIRIIIGCVAAFYLSSEAHALRDLFFKWLVPAPVARAEAGWNDWIQVAIQGVCFAVFGCSLDFANLTNAVSGLAKAADNATKLTELFTTIREWFLNVFNLCCEMIGVEIFEWAKPRDTAIRNFLSRTDSLMQRFSENPMNITYQMIDEVTRLSMEIADFKTGIGFTSKNQPALIAIKTIADKIDNLKRLVETAGMRLGERYEPAFLPWSGVPGCGKTYFTEFYCQHIAVNLAQDFEELLDVQRNWRRKVYCWPVDDKHHDQYKGEDIMVFPDLFTKTDAEGVISEANMLVYAVGDNPMELPAAELYKKQKLFNISKVIIASTNVVLLHPSMFKSLRNVDALGRRFNQCGWYVSVNKKYALLNPDGSIVIDPSTHKVRGREHDDDLYAQVDPAKVEAENADTVPEDLWSFRRLNYLTGSFMDNRVYDQRGMMEFTMRFIKNKMRKGQDKKDKLARKLVSLVERRMEELNNPMEAQAHDAEFSLDPHHVETPPIETFEGAYDHAVRGKARQIKKDYILERQVKRELAKAYKEEVLDLEEFVDADSGEDYSDMPDLEPDTPGPGRSEMNDEEKEYEVIPRHYELGDDALNAPKKTIYEMYPDVYAKVNNPRVEQGRKDYEPIALKMLFKTISITREQYDHIRLVIDETIYKFQNSSTEDRMNFRTIMGKYSDARNPERGMMYQCMYRTIAQLESDPLVYNIVRHLKVSDIFNISVKTYEEVSAELNNYVIDYYFKDPFFATLYKVRNSYMDLYNAIMYSGFAVSVRQTYADVKAAARRLYFSQEFQNALSFFCMGAGYMTGILIPLTLFDLFMAHRRKKEWEAKRAVLKADQKEARKEKRAEEKAEEEKRLEAILDSAVAEANNGLSKKDKPDPNIKFVEDRIDNFAAVFYVVHRITETRKTAWVRSPCNMFFLGRKIGVMVDHARVTLYKLQDLIKDEPLSYIEVHLVPITGGAYNLTKEHCKLSEIKITTTRHLQGFDMAVFEFPVAMRDRTYIMNHIPPKECMEWMIQKKDIHGLLVRRPKDPVTFAMTEREVKEPIVLNYRKTLAYESGTSLDGHEYPRLCNYHYSGLEYRGLNRELTTVVGDCSTIGIITDPRKNHCVNKGWPQAQQPWIAYFHTSSYNGIPAGVALYREMFSEWEEAAKGIAPVAEEIEKTMDIYEAAVVKHLGVEGVAEENSVITEVINVDKNHFSLGYMEKKFFEPFKTEIKRSPLYGAEGIPEPTRYPTVFGKDVTIKAREDYGNNTAVLNNPVVKDIIYQAMEWVQNHSPVRVDPSLLSLEQCLYGDSAYNLPAVNWQSSAGFFLRYLKDKYKFNWKAKSWMLGSDARLKPEVYALIEELFTAFDEQLKRGERVLSVIIDNIKDELLALEKVRDRKGRAYFTYDFIYTLLVRKYFGSFAGWIFANKINNGIAIGVNPYSSDWTHIVDKILQNSSKCIFLDHSKFDKNCLRWIMQCVLVLATMFYGDKGSENERIREMLFMEIWQSVHVVMYEGRMYFYTWDQGNTSGNFLTAILNSLINICYMFICCVYAWLHFHGVDPQLLTACPANPVSEAMSMVCLGDDVVMSINDEKLPGVNFNTICAVAKMYLNLTITDELKTGGVIPDFRDITEGSFLGRSFTPHFWEGRVIYKAGLRDYSIFDRAIWIKGEYDPEVEIMKIESMNLEMAWKSQELFDRYVPIYADLCFKHYRRYPRFTNYDIAFRYVLTLGDYKYSFDMDESEMVDIEKIMKQYKKAEALHNGVFDPAIEFPGCILEKEMELVEITTENSLEENDAPPSLRRLA